MVKEIRYTTIQRVLDNLHDDSMMQDLTLEQAVRYAVRFIGKNGLPKMYQDKQAIVDIHEWRGLLPCDLISIQQIKDLKTGICLRAMEDTFVRGMNPPERRPKPMPNNNGEIIGQYIPPMHYHEGELRFKTQERVIFTSFPEGQVEIAYRAIPIDENGFPLLLDNEVYLSALESYITLKVLQQKFRKNEISVQAYQDAKQEYMWEVGQLNSELVMPSQSEMESITRLWNTMLPSMKEFDYGFRYLGNRELIRKH